MIPGRGHESIDCITGDLHVTIEQAVHPFVKRKGRDLFFEKNISLREAIYGFEIPLNFLGRKIILKSNPEGNMISTGMRYSPTRINNTMTLTSTSTLTSLLGKTQWIQGAGMPSRNAYKKSRVGNLFIEYKVTMPNRMLLKEGEAFNVSTK